MDWLHVRGKIMPGFWFSDPVTEEALEPKQFAYEESLRSHTGTGKIRHVSVMYFGAVPLTMLNIKIHTLYVILARMEANVDPAEHDWHHGRGVGGWRRNEWQHWWLVVKGSVQSRVFQRELRCNSQSSTNQQRTWACVDHPCRDNVETQNFARY